MQARTTGAILMISGRVPTTIAIFTFPKPSCLWCVQPGRSAPARRESRPPACVFGRAAAGDHHTAVQAFKPTGPQGSEANRAMQARGRESARRSIFLRLGNPRPLSRWRCSMTFSWLARALAVALLVALGAGFAAAGPRVTVYSRDL